MIVAVSSPFPGVSRVLEEGEKLGLWKFVRMASGDRVIIPPAQTYILGAWHPSYQPLVGNLGGRLGVLWTSSAGEMEFQPVEIEYLFAILNDPRVEFIWFGDRSLAQAFPHKGFYAPYPVAPMDPIHVLKQEAISLFCPDGPKKNILNQLIAVSIIQKRRQTIQLFTNLSSREPLLKALGIKYRLFPWLPKEQYHRVLASCRLNLACSWAETFNYQAVEAAMLGVPSVTSPTIPLTHLRVENPNSPWEIAERGLQGLEDTSLMKRVAGEVEVILAHNQALRGILKAQGLLALD